LIKAVIFDCFGVVVADALSGMTRQLYVDQPELEAQVCALLDQANSGQITSEQSSIRMAVILGLSHADYRAQIQQNEVRNQQLLDYILSLRQNYKIALLSNIPRGSLKRRFSDQELQTYFDAVVASGDVGYAKPEPQAYEITAERLGVRLDECVFTDDREHYCEGARAVGMQAILYQDFTRFRRDLEAVLSQPEK